MTNDKDITQKIAENVPPPEFKPEWIEAFLAFALASHGDYVGIPIEKLKTYKFGGVHPPVWHEATKSFILATARIDVKKLIKTLNGEPIIETAKFMPNPSRN
jgi:hypothetical protein